MFSLSSFFEIQAAAHLHVGAYLAVGHGHVGRVDRIALQRRRVGEGGIQHQVGVGTGQALGLHMDLHQAGDLSGQTFQPGLDARFDLRLFFGGQAFFQRPEDDVLGHGSLSFRGPVNP